MHWEVKGAKNDGKRGWKGPCMRVFSPQWRFTVVHLVFKVCLDMVTKESMDNLRLSYSKRPAHETVSNSGSFFLLNPPTYPLFQKSFSHLRNTDNIPSQLFSLHF